MSKGNRSFVLGLHHDALLKKLAAAAGVSLTDTMRRALEALEEKQAAREKELSK